MNPGGRPFIHINERLAVNMRKGGFKIRHIAQAFGVSAHKIKTTLARYPDAVPCYDTADKTRAASLARAARLAWLSAEYRDEYRRLCVQGRIPAREAKHIILAQIERDKNSGLAPVTLSPGFSRSPVEASSWTRTSLNSNPRGLQTAPRGSFEGEAA
jgi:hypothetical protein